MKNKLLALPLIGLAIFSCKKEESKSETTKTDILVQQSWKFDNAGLDIDKNGAIDNPLPGDLTPSCLTDNTVSFAKDGTGTVDEGAERCDPADPQTSTFNWNFTDNETYINISGNAITGTNGGKFKILELSNTKFSLSKDTTFPGVPLSVTVIVNLKH